MVVELYKVCPNSPVLLYPCFDSTSLPFSPLPYCVFASHNHLFELRALFLLDCQSEED